MFAPMTPMTERIRHHNESSLAQHSTMNTWNPLAALCKALSVNRQQSTQRDAARRPARPIEGPAADTAC